MTSKPEQDFTHPSETRDNNATQEWAERWLSSDRLTPYLESCDGNIERALKLYEWNSNLSQIIMRDISYFEVALRNAYDRTMSESWDGAERWLIDNDSPARRPVMRKSKRGELDANRINRKTIDSVISRLPGNASTGSIIANLTLGFWVHLTDRSREATIWRTALWRAWPKGTNRQRLQPRLEGILRLRNRAAHAERLFDPSQESLSPLKVDADAMELLHDLCPDAAEWLWGSEEESPARRYVQKNPAPANVQL